MAITLTTEQFQALLNAVSQGHTPAIPTNTPQPLVFNEFCDSIKFLSIRKLQNMNIIDFIVATIKYNFDALEETQYPFVCSNLTKKHFYVYTETGWKKGSDFMNKLYSIIVKQAYKDLDRLYSIKYMDDDDDDDDEEIEKKYNSSKHAEKQEIIMNLCHTNKINWETVCEKALTKLSKIIKVDTSPS
jgi:hypothetical protein